MSTPLYFCLRIPEFAAQALIRLRPALASAPVAVLEGEAPLEKACAATLQARRLGVRHGMTRTELESFPNLTILRRSPQEEGSAALTLLEMAARFTPRAEELPRTSAHTLALDLTGSTRLLGPPHVIGQKLFRAARELGFFARIASSRNLGTAACLVRAPGNQLITVPPAKNALSPKPPPHRPRSHPRAPRHLHLLGPTYPRRPGRPRPTRPRSPPRPGRPPPPSTRHRPARPPPRPRRTHLHPRRAPRLRRPRRQPRIPPLRPRPHARPAHPPRPHTAPSSSQPSLSPSTSNAPPTKPTTTAKLPPKQIPRQIPRQIPKQIKKQIKKIDPHHLPPAVILSAAKDLRILPLHHQPPRIPATRVTHPLLRKRWDPNHHPPMTPQTRVAHPLLRKGWGQRCLRSLGRERNQVIHVQLLRPRLKHHKALPTPHNPPTSAP